MKKNDDGIQRWGDHPEPKTPGVTVNLKPELEVHLPPQHDAPHVFRFNCPDCKRPLTLAGRLGNWILRALAV